MAGNTAPGFQVLGNTATEQSAYRITDQLTTFGYPRLEGTGSLPVVHSYTISASVVVGTRDTLPRRVPHRPCLDGCPAPNESPTIEQEGKGMYNCRGILGSRAKGRMFRWVLSAVCLAVNYVEAYYVIFHPSEVSVSSGDTVPSSLNCCKIV